MSLRRYSRTVEPVGAKGAAKATVTAPLRGECSIHVVALTFSGAPETTVVEITDTFSGAQILKVTSKTDAIFYPVVAASTTAGKASTLTEVVPIAGRLTIAVSGSDPGATVAVGIVAREG